MKYSFGNPPTWNKASELVQRILVRNKGARDNDWDLFFEAWSEQGVEIPEDLQIQLRAAYSPETLRRSRQDIQAKDSWLRGERYEYRKNLADKYRKRFA